MSEISINKALQQAKLLDSRITKATTQLKAFGVYSKGKMQESSLSKEQFLNNATSSYESLTKLIDNRSKLRAAINASNAVTVINFFGKDYTVFELLELKQTIAYWESILHTTSRQEMAVNDSVNYINQQVDENIQAIISQRQTASGQIPKDFIEVTTKSLHDLNGAEIVAPLTDTLEELTSKIEKYKSEVDFALTEINALTKINVSFLD